jgi:2-aminobenzoate-CoA ligase
VSLVLCDGGLRDEVPPSLEVVAFGDGRAGSLEALAAAKGSAAFRAVDTAADDICLVAFTSGTTGRPKGTMHFHRDLAAICELFPRSVLDVTEDDVFCGTPPLAFTFGLGGLLLFPLRFGATTVLIPQLAPKGLPEVIARFGATVCFTAPTGYRQMMPLVGEHRLGRLRACVSAGEALPIDTRTKWRERTGIELIDGLGTTEMLHIFLSAPSTAVRPGATGRAIAGYEACVLDERGQPLGPGEVGRLAVKGPTGCRYLDDPRQRDYVQGGWNVTGDSYSRDEDGYFWFHARTDDMIVSAGYNIAGPEVEDALGLHPHVVECACVGVPDAERGQVVKALVVLRPERAGDDELVAELQDFVKSRLAPYKYPRLVEFVDSLPRTATGKLQRARLR